MNTRTLTDDEVEILNGEETMEDALPIKFDSGFLVTGFAITCGQCNRPMRGKELKARAVWTIDQEVMNITVVGSCNCCNVLTVVKRRIKSNERGTLVEFFDQDGQWRSLEFKQKGSIWKWMKSLFWK